MKKLVFGLMLMSGIASASCVGPYCWDETGAYINGVIINGVGVGHPSSTLAGINALTPTAAGQEMYCSNCVNSSVCISSGTGKGAYVNASSPTVHCDVR